jgi:hypothetical protein
MEFHTDLFLNSICNKQVFQINNQKYTYHSLDQNSEKNLEDTVYQTTAYRTTHASENHNETSHKRKIKT